jgi:hypothetical protein
MSRNFDGLERYYVCSMCAHYWLSPYPPDDRRCESCARVGVVSSFDTLERAELASDSVYERLNEQTSTEQARRA